jgi:predicted enzyme related to lactoylglutathione lyase
VEDVEAAATRLVELGGRVVREVEREPEYDLAFVADPDGIWIELVHSKPPH